MKSATALLETVRRHWRADRAHVREALSCLGGARLETQAIASVMPPELFVGAAEARRAEILFGQPLRCRSFSSAILGHELAHIFLYRAGETNFMAGEIVAMSVEAEIHRLVDGTDIRTVWSPGELDEFHAAALSAAVGLGPSWQRRHRHFKGLLSAVRDRIDARVLALEPPRGLLRNLRPRALAR